MLIKTQKPLGYRVKSQEKGWAITPPPLPSGRSTLLSAMTMMIMQLTAPAQAQNTGQGPSELTLSQVLEFCGTRIKEHDEYKVAAFAESAANERDQAKKPGREGTTPAERALFSGTRLDNAQRHDDRAADLRARGHQSEQSIASPSTLVQVNGASTAKEVEVMTEFWIRELVSTGGSRPYAAPSMLCMLALRSAQIEGKPLGSISSGGSTGHGACPTATDAKGPAVCRR